MKNLSNNFLISMPHVSDPIFKQSLIYICNHDKNGAMGLIINKPISNLQLNQEVESILKETKLSKMNPTPNIYFGGPVDLNMGIILHPLDYITNKTMLKYNTRTWLICCVILGIPCSILSGKSFECKSAWYL